jgi:superfamily II DNA or RNA helicase
LKYNTKTHLELHDTGLDEKTEYQREMDFSISNSFRNGIICTIAKATKSNTLIMVDRIFHGEELFRLLNAEGHKKVHFIQGDVEVSQREEIRKLMESESDVICIAISSIFSTGINIKNIHNIIFCTPGKAKVKLIQSIGRGLRLHKDKTQLTVYDIADEFKYSNRHMEKRLKLYNQENIKYEIKEFCQPTS